MDPGSVKLNMLNMIPLKISCMKWGVSTPIPDGFLYKPLLGVGGGAFYNRPILYKKVYIFLTFLCMMLEVEAGIL